MKNQNNSIRPNHYKLKNGLEVIDIISMILPVEYFCIGNVIKYVFRYQGKNGVQDLEKARWYLDRAIKVLDKKQKKKSD